MIIPEGIVTVAVPRCRAKLKGDSMKNHILRSAMMFTAGAMTMAAVMYAVPAKPAQAPVAHGNDKFSMATVPLIETGLNEAVFVLNHLTGALVGSALNERTGTFTHRYLHNVAADFQTSSKDPRYAIVSGPANLQSTGPNAPAFGVLYIAELSSGNVIAYGFPRPTNRNAGDLALVKMDFFKFADSVGN